MSKTEWRRPPPRRVRAIRDRLRLVYGRPLAEPHGHPIAELILTVLSQSTNDRNRDVAYLALRERFPTWEEVRDAPVDAVEEAIRPGGISRIKSARIKSILRAITDTAPESAPDDRGSTLSLDWLAGQPASRGGGRAGAAIGEGGRVGAALGGREGGGPGGADVREGEGGRAGVAGVREGEGGRAGVAGLGEGGGAGGADVRERGGGLTVPEAQRYLTSLPGVGRKTAACVLLFALGMRDVPVDTHVSRVGTRLGMFRPGAPFEELHDTMLEITPPGEELELHLNLLRHGRRTCYARRPNCPGCALRRMCPSADMFG